MYQTKKSFSRTSSGKSSGGGIAAARKPHTCQRLAPPRCHPPPGVYEVDELRVSLSCPSKLPTTAAARIANMHATASAGNSVKFAYTLDGTPPMYSPNLVSPHIHILSSDKEPLILRGKGVYTIRAVSAKDGLVESRASDFAFRLLGSSNSNSGGLDSDGSAASFSIGRGVKKVAAGNSNNSNNNSNAAPPIPVPRSADNLPPLLAVPLYERFAAEKTGNAGSRAGTSSVPLNRSVNASLVAGSASSHPRSRSASPGKNNASAATHATNNSNNNSNHNNAALETRRYVADHTAITAVRAAPISREGGASVVTQNAALSSHIVSELLQEQMRQNVTLRAPLPSTLPGSAVFIANYHEQSPFDHHREINNSSHKQQAAGSVSRRRSPNRPQQQQQQLPLAPIEELDMSEICAPLANAIAQQQQHYHHQQQLSHDNSTVTAVAGGVSSFISSNMSGVASGSGFSSVRQKHSMKFGAGSRGPWSAAPEAGTLVGALPRAATAEPAIGAASKGSIVNVSGIINKAATVTSDLTLNRRAVTPALQRQYANPIDGSAFPSPLTQLIAPVLPQPRRDATLQGPSAGSMSVGARITERQLHIEELRAREQQQQMLSSTNNTSGTKTGALRKHHNNSQQLLQQQMRRVPESNNDMLSFAAVASSVPEGTALAAARPLINKVARLAQREAEAMAEHTRLQLLWYDAREDQLKKKRRYVAKEVESDASFNELMLTHDPAERALDREYVRNAAAIVANSKMSLPPTIANDYNCAATSFFPGSDIAQTSGPFLRFYHALDEISPYLCNILRHVPYRDLHYKLDSDALREMYKSGAPNDLNTLFNDFFLPQHTCRIPPAVVQRFLKVGPNVSHLLLALRHCVWTNIALLAEAPFLLLVQFCSIAARPASYTLGSEWDEVSQYIEHRGEANHYVTTLVPHIAFEMALSLYRRNLDQQHTAELAQRAKQNLAEHLAQARSQQQHQHSPSSPMGSVVASRLQQEKRRAVLHKMSQAAITENAARREHLREVDALAKLVPWQHAGADSAGKDSNNNTISGGGDDSADDGGGKPQRRSWGQNIATTFIQDAYLANVLYEMEHKLPRLFKSVKQSTNVAETEMYADLMP